MRITEVIRLHTVNRMQAYGWPLIIMLASLAIVLVIGALVLAVSDGQAREGMRQGMLFNGAIFALLGPLIGFGFAAMGQYFPLALGLGLTRREFALGTLAVFVGNALFFAVLITIGKVIESATEGFGLGIRFFDVVYTGTGAWWQTFVQTFLLILCIALIGAAITTAYHRWGQPFLWVFWIGLAVVALAIVAAMLLSEPARAFGSSVLAMGWGPWMVFTAAVGLLGGVAWLVLVRRAQAR